LISIAPFGNVVAITGFERFETLYNYDFVTFYDGSDEQAAVLFLFTGFIYNLDPIYSSGRFLRVIFKRYFHFHKLNMFLLF
jgi:hypothetical protein